MRAEMGYPILVTPVSQFVASQAARNVIDPERWANVSDETVRYFLGHYGEPLAPVDPEIADRVLARPQAREAPRSRADQLDGARDAVRHADLRRGAAAAADDARRAGRRDGRRARQSRRRRPRGRGARRSSRSCRSSRGAPRSLRSRCTRTATPWSGAVLLTARASTTSAGSCSTSTARSSTAGPTAAAARSPAPSRCSSGSAPRAGRSSCSRTAATSAPTTIARGLREDGLPVGDDELLTPVESAITYLRRHHAGQPVLLFASAAIRPS